MGHGWGADCTSSGIALVPRWQRTFGCEARFDDVRLDLRLALQIIDDAIQAWGGAGVTTDSGLARMYASQRTLRLADGPDEVHREAIARLELKKGR